jgi:hypothetical protein
MTGNQTAPSCAVPSQDHRGDVHRDRPGGVEGCARVVGEPRLRNRWRPIIVTLVASQNGWTMSGEPSGAGAEPPHGQRLAIAAR